MNKYVFVYDFLMKDVENKEYGLLKYECVGRLYGYKRVGSNFIVKSKDPCSCVVGDIFKLDTKLENTLDRFYREFGYDKTIITAYHLLSKDEDEGYSCVVYYLKEDEDNMISKEEMKEFGSSEPFEFMKEAYDITEKRFRESYIDDKTEINHILPTNVEGFLKEVELIKEHNPNSKILLSGFAIVTE